MKRVAVFGDVHGRLDLLQNLYGMLEHESIDEIRHSGDLIDRGPDSGGVVMFCKDNGIQGVMGNHEGGLIEHNLKPGKPPGSADKLRSYNQLMALPPEYRQYLYDLPHIHVDDAIQTVFVHGGVYPGIPFHLQPTQGVCHMGLIHPNHPPNEKSCPTRWFRIDKKGITEDQHRANGWNRWYEVWDHPYRVVFGHCVFDPGPNFHQPPNGGLCIGVDTGANWTGVLTAVILPDLKVIQTPRERFTTDSEITESE